MRTCAICGAELPEGLRHGAKYCPHGRCKTKAYRQRKHNPAQKIEPTSPELASSGSRHAPPSSPQLFTHTVACPCGQLLTIQILISQAQTGAPDLSEAVATMPTASNTEDKDSTSHDGPVQLPLTQMAVEAAAPSAPMQSAVALDPPMSAPQSVELSDPAVAQRAEEAVAPPPERAAKPDAGLGVEEEASAASHATPESPLPVSAPEPAVVPSDALLNKDFWRLAKERPADALAVFSHILERGHSGDNPLLIERAYCGMALIYALRGDGTHAAERLSQARIAAVGRGNISEVESVAQQIDLLLAANKA